MTRGELITQYNTTCHFYFYSSYDQTSGIIWWKKKVHKAYQQWHVAVLFSAINTPLVSLDLIGEKNQII